jgi:quinol-cytochrome oxidoreductase complex cytochrome b subunit
MALPAVLLALMALHLYLVRRHHIAGPVLPKRGQPVPFYPDQLFKDAIVQLVGVGLLIYLALANRPGLEPIANPTQVEFAPRPEWYFLGLYELLKIMPSGYEVVATVIIPGLVSLGMIFLPWLDRSESRHPARRQWIIMTGMAVILMIGLLTLKGVLETPPPHGKTGAGEESVATDAAPVTPRRNDR